MEATSTPGDTTNEPDAFGTLDELECRGRDVFVRLDASWTRSEAGPTTISHLLELGARVTVGTSLEASEDGGHDVEALGLRLSEALEVEVLVPEAPTGAAVRDLRVNLRDRQICLLPDLGAERGEHECSETLARHLAQGIDAYVGDAFGALHHGYASTLRLPRLVARRALGYQARTSLETLAPFTPGRREPFALVLGGLRFSDKAATVRALLPRLSLLAAAGGVASTLLAARGGQADALAEVPRLAEARSVLRAARERNVTVLLPADRRVRTREGQMETKPAAQPDDQVVDVGPETLRTFTEALGTQRRVLFWGPLGDIAADADATMATSTHALLTQLHESDSEVVMLGRDLARVASAAASATGSPGLTLDSRSARALIMTGRLPGLEALRRPS